MKTRMVSVPIMADGQVLGYVVTRLQFSADYRRLKPARCSRKPFVADEAFQAHLRYDAGRHQNRSQAGAAGADGEYREPASIRGLAAMLSETFLSTVGPIFRSKT